MRKGTALASPEELRYTEDHEWVAERPEGAVRIGITDYAQDQLGDVVFIDLPETGKQLAAGDVFGEIESTKSVSELYAPVAGEVVAVNAGVVDTPETVNSDPFGEGWLIELKPDEAETTGGLLDAVAYQQLIEG